jgi:hypothetical protein
MAFLNDAPEYVRTPPDQFSQGRSLTASQNIPLYESVNSRTNQARIGYGTVKEDVPYWASVFFVRIRSVTYEVVWSK